MDYTREVLSGLTWKPATWSAFEEKVKSSHISRYSGTPLTPSKWFAEAQEWQIVTNCHPSHPRLIREAFRRVRLGPDSSVRLCDWIESPEKSQESWSHHSFWEANRGLEDRDQEWRIIGKFIQDYKADDETLTRRLVTDQGELLCLGMSHVNFFRLRRHRRI